MSIAQLTLPMFIGTVLNWALFGALLVQSYMYFLAFPKDPRLSKVVVAVVFILELVETIANSRDAIRIFGAGWGSMDALNDVGWAWITVPVLGALTASVGQLFYARRLYILSGNVYAPGVVILVSLTQLSAGIWTGTQVYTAKEFSLVRQETLALTATWHAATSLCDLIIVCSTAYYLIKARRPEFMGNTNMIVSRVIKLTAETGVLCAIFALVDLYLFVTFKGTNYHLAVCTELSKVYSNSILLILNWRAHIGHRHAPATNISRHICSDIAFKTGTIPSSSVHVELAGRESFASQDSGADEDSQMGRSTV